MHGRSKVLSSKVLTLISLTSERPCQIWGRGLQEPPLSILALEPNLAQNSCSPERWHQFQLIWPFFRNFFSINPQKISESWNSTEKSLKMGEISKICDFWAISTCNTSKKRIFHIEFNFKQRKYDLLEKNMKKSNFFDFFFQNRYWPVVVDCNFFKFVVRNFKTKLLYVLERFWR